MKSIVITPKSETELEFISGLLKRLGVNSKVLTEEERENIGLAYLMRGVDRTKKVSKKTILKKLR